MYSQPKLMPYGCSGAEIWYRTDRMTRCVQRAAFSQFCFAQVDFSRFSFRSAPTAVPVDVRRRVRHAWQFQLLAKNEKEEEPFGLLGLTIRFAVRHTARSI